MGGGQQTRRGQWGRGEGTYVILSTTKFKNKYFPEAKPALRNHVTRQESNTKDPYTFLTTMNSRASRSPGIFPYRIFL